MTRVKDNNPIGTQKIVSLDFDEKKAREGNFKNRLSNCHYMDEILQMLRKTLSKQSINQPFLKVFSATYIDQSNRNFYASEGISEALTY